MAPRGGVLATVWKLRALPAIMLLTVLVARIDATARATEAHATDGRVLAPSVASPTQLHHRRFPVTLKAADDESTQPNEPPPPPPSVWDDARAVYARLGRPAAESTDMPEAVELLRLRAALKVGPNDAVRAELQKAAGEAQLAFWKAKADRLAKTPEFRRLLTPLARVFNVALLLIILRTTLPRILTMQSMSDLGEIARSLGLPGREELAGYVEAVAGYNFWVKVAAYQGIILLEKVFMLTEFLPLGIILPTISPIVFGGVWEGALITAICSMNGATLDFLLGRAFLAERVRNSMLFGQEPVKDRAWFKSLCASIKSDGFKVALLLRLAPILPIPFDAHWYVCGVTPMRLAEFMPAQLIGALKVCFVDAYLGNLLIRSTLDSGALGTGRTVMIAETVGLVLISVVVTSVATDLFTKVLAGEGWDNTPGSGK
eukprot:EG_transcript_10861